MNLNVEYEKFLLIFIRDSVNGKLSNLREKNYLMIYLPLAIALSSKSLKEY